jgi:uncharacterized protein
MAMLREVNGVKCLMGRLAHGADLLDELTSVCTANGVTLGWVHALGALQKARLGYYDQNKQEYRYIDLDRHLEITNLVGNVSLKDGKPIVHAHVTLADDRGNAFGGHLAPGTIIFACEFCLQILDGPEFSRALDAQTGLPLWKM